MSATDRVAGSVRHPLRGRTDARHRARQRFSTTVSPAEAQTRAPRQPTHGQPPPRRRAVVGRCRSHRPRRRSGHRPRRRARHTPDDAAPARAGARPCRRLGGTSLRCTEPGNAPLDGCDRARRSGCRRGGTRVVGSSRRHRDRIDCVRPRGGTLRHRRRHRGTPRSRSRHRDHGWRSRRRGDHGRRTGGVSRPRGSGPTPTPAAEAPARCHTTGPVPTAGGGPGRAGPRRRLRVGPDRERQGGLRRSERGRRGPRRPPGRDQPAPPDPRGAHRPHRPRHGRRGARGRGARPRGPQEPSRALPDLGGQAASVAGRRRQHGQRRAAPGHGGEGRQGRGARRHRCPGLPAGLPARAPPRRQPRQLRRPGARLPGGRGRPHDRQDRADAALAAPAPRPAAHG